MKLLIIFFLFLPCYVTANDSKITHNLQSSSVGINAHAGDIIEFNNSYYWYGEKRNAINNDTDGVSVYQSQDLTHWDYKGLALDPKLENNEGASGIIERPKVIYSSVKNRFFMYFHHELPGKGYSSALLGIAVADKATGPFKYLKSFRINPSVLPIGYENLSNIRYGNYFLRDFKNGQMSRDITIFEDSNSSVYIVSVSEDNSTLIISELDSSLTRLTGRYSRVSPGGYNEAPILFKKNGVYFLMTSGVTGWKPNQSKLYMSKNIFSGWKEIRGIVKSDQHNIKTTFGAQGSFVFKYHNDFYIFLDVWNERKIFNSGYLVKEVFWDNGLPYIK